ncbi:hypothetical protein SNE40_016241 [Patella caerulea]|uniref:NADH dehydrogenase [ubiquinone] 1 subunit C2 n=1 Tax=Patella caerulea TaxID=87958 RepID=A0AAN8JDT5_PATCE
MRIEGVEKLSNFYSLFFGTLGVGAAIVYNISRSRPGHSSIYLHIGLGALGYYTGDALNRYKQRAINQRMVVLQDYMARHPEDFVGQESKKFKDVFQPWTPVR